MKALQRVVWSLIFLAFVVHMVMRRGRKFRYSKGSKKISVKCLEESTSDGRGCLTGGPVNGHGMRELFVKKIKKRETARVRTQGPLKKTAKVGT